MSSQQEGLFPRVWHGLWGKPDARLTERGGRAHLLSYLLIFAQSIAVLLVFGHAEVGLLFDPRWPLKVVAMLVLALLVITVLAADWALIESIKRLGPLARNQQTWTWFEHFIYSSFVFVVEGVTFGVVLVALDSDTNALVEWKPLIPTSGWLFYAVITLRVLLTGWAGIQLIIVRTPLPVLLSTLMNTGKEIIGAHLERMLKTLDLANQNLPALFRVYAAMSKPRRPISGWFGWRLKMALAREAEEDRQVDLVYNGLVALAGTGPAAPFGIDALPTQYLPQGARDDFRGGPDDDGPGGGVPPTDDEWDTSEWPAVSGILNGHGPHRSSVGFEDRGEDDAERTLQTVGRKKGSLTAVERRILKHGKEAARLDILRQMIEEAGGEEPTVTAARTAFTKAKLGTNDREVRRLLGELRKDSKLRSFRQRLAGAASSASSVSPVSPVSQAAQ